MCKKNWNVFCFVLFTSHMFSSYTLPANRLDYFILGARILYFGLPYIYHKATQQRASRIKVLAIYDKVRQDMKYVCSIFINEL